MVNFYCIDGPKKGQFIKSDFKPTEISSGETYYKHTFVIREPLMLYADVASIHKDLRVLESTEGVPFYFRQSLTNILDKAP